MLRSTQRNSSGQRWRPPSVRPPRRARRARLRAEGVADADVAAIVAEVSKMPTPQPPAPTLEVNQRRAVQLPVQGRGRTLEQALGHVVEYGQARL